MSGLGPEGPIFDATPPAQYEEVAPSAGPVAWVLVLLHLALGVVAVALAVNEEFAAGKVSFAGEGWRVGLGLAGAALTLSALRGAVRTVSGTKVTLDPAHRRRAKRRGWVFFAIGAGFVVASAFDDLARESVAFDSWAKTLFLVGGIELMLLGVVFQGDPSRTIRRQRIARGEGVHGVARIVGAGDTGTSVNEQPQVRIDFEIDVDGCVHRVSDRIVMQRSRLALLIPGSTVDVLVDRADPSVFRVDWDSWRGPDSAERSAFAPE